MTYFSYRDKFAISRFGKTIILATMGLGAVLWYEFLPWTPAIELLLTGFWIYAAMLLTLSKTPQLSILNNWPNIALGLYLVNWPAAQLILLGWPTLSPIELIVISVPLSTALAFLAHMTISKPIYRFADSLSYQEGLSKPPALSQ